MSGPDDPRADAAREAILARIRAAVGGAPDLEPTPRAYRVRGDRPRDALLDLFVERLEDYRVIVHRCAATDAGERIAEILRARGAERIVIPDGLDPGWLPEGGPAWLPDEGLDARALDTVDGVLTTCATAVADTGTIVLDGGPGQGRRAITLVPDYHLCLVRAEDVVETVPEAVRRLAGAVRAGRPLTMVSGPSATSDIELSRVEGVHGPRTLEVIVLTT